MTIAQRAAAGVGGWCAAALAGVIAMAGPAGRASAQGVGVEFRIVEREGQTTISSAADAQLNLAVQARVVGGGAMQGVGLFVLNMGIANEPESYGTLERGLTSNVDGTYASGVSVSNVVGVGGLPRQYSFLAGFNPGFNGLINVSGGTFVNTPTQEIGLISGASLAGTLLGTPGVDVDDDGVPDTYPGTGTTAPLDAEIAQTYFGAAGNWIDVYRFRYTATNLTSRTLTFELSGTSAQVFSGLRTTNGVWGLSQVAATSTQTSPFSVTVAVSDMGACCDDVGGCTISTGVACAGSFVVGVPCSPDPCPPLGVCCAMDGSCRMSIQTSCSDPWMTGGTCSPNPCAQPGACCSSTDVCTLVLQSACQGLSWMPTTCTPTACGEPGACCGSDCQLLTLHNCTSGRTWMAGTCTPNSCPTPGACCSPTDACTLVLQSACTGLSWTAGACTVNVCGAPGACCGADCQLLTLHNCTGGRTWMAGTCTPSPCPAPLACCNPSTGACSVVAPVSDVTYTLQYAAPNVAYARNDDGGTVQTFVATYSPFTKRLVFDVSLSGATPGTAPLTRGFWLVLSDGPNPKHHAGELAIFYFDASTPATPRMTVYGYNGVAANTSWRDGDASTAGDQPGDLIKGSNETGYINQILAEDNTVSGEMRRHFRFDINATDIVSHVPLYPAASPWFGTGFARTAGIWLHPVASWNATYEGGFGAIAGRLTSLTTGTEGWLDASGRVATGNDPCPQGTAAAPGMACTPSNTCPASRACCNGSSGVCVVVGAREECPTGYAFASPGASTCSPNPCPSFALQVNGVCCNVLTGACCLVPLSGCTPGTHAWHAGSACGPQACPASQGACCNVLTGGCAVTARAACGEAAHDWRAGGACSPNPCDVPGICCNTAAGTCRRATQSRCAVGSTWAPTGACTPNPCGGVGRCCNVVTGACQMMVQSACAPAAHEWMPGATCTPNPCGVVGACCNAASGACRRLTESRCGAGNAWAIGACAPNPCVAQGPCCNITTGACQMTLRTACPPMGHDWMPGAACSPSPCDVPGVCCTLETGVCRRVTEARCTAGGIWVPAGVCSPSPCAMPQGACCNVVTGTCAVSMRAECAPAAHEWMAGGTCTPNTCDAPAACCIAAMGVCRRLTEVRCMAAQGTWLSGQTCSPTACVVQAVRACAADFDGSGRVDVQDVLAYVGAWFADDVRADVREDGEVDVQDLFQYLSAWFVGCG